MSEIDNRLGRIEDKLDKLINHMADKLGRHDVELAKLKMQVKWFIAITTFLALGGSGTLGFLKFIGG